MSHNVISMLKHEYKGGKRFPRICHATRFIHMHSRNSGTQEKSIGEFQELTAFDLSFNEPLCQTGKKKLLS